MQKENIMENSKDLTGNQNDSSVPDKTENVFEIRDLKYLDILDIPSMDIKSGLITSVVGRSGAGKSTLLKLLDKIISPDSGSIYYRGTDTEKMDSLELRKKITMLSQTAVIFKGDIGQNLSIGRVFQGKTPPTEEEMLDALKSVRLSKKPSDSPSELSGGEKQRLCVARVMLMDSDVYLLDEPSSALDSETESIIFERIIEHVRKNGKTLILVTHSREKALSMSDEVFEISKGSSMLIGGEK